MGVQTEDAKVVNEVRGVFVSLPLTKPTRKSASSGGVFSTNMACRFDPDKMP